MVHCPDCGDEIGVEEKEKFVPSSDVDQNETVRVIDGLDTYRTSEIFPRGDITPSKVHTCPHCGVILGITGND